MKGTEPRLSHPVSLRRISPRGPGSARCDGTGDGKRRGSSFHGFHSSLLPPVAAAPRAR